MYPYINSCTSSHLTIEDVMNWEVGHEADVVIWDRNFEEYWIWDNAEEEKLYDPKEFFRKNRHKLTYKGNMVWDIHFIFNETFEHQVHLDVAGLPTNWTWCVLDDDGTINITSERLKEGEEIPPERKPICMHWTEFPTSTRVGWRGPIMLWDDLDKYGKVYYKKIN